MLHYGTLEPQTSDDIHKLSLLLPLVSREWKNGSNSSYNCTPFLHSLLTKGKFFRPPWGWVLPGFWSWKAQGFEEDAKLHHGRLEVQAEDGSCRVGLGLRAVISMSDLLTSLRTK